MNFKETIIIKGTPKKVFDRYKDVPSWAKWDEGVEYASIDGDFVTGAKGKLKAPKAPVSKLTWIEVTENKSFTLLIDNLPLCKIYFEHTIEEVVKGELKITHSVSFKGLLSFIFGKMIGNGIKKGLPDVLQNLKKLAE